MARNDIRINHAVAEDILKGRIGNVIPVMESIARETAAATGKPDDYKIETWVGVNRARVSIVTATWAARRDEAINHTLLGALGQSSG